MNTLEYVAQGRIALRSGTLRVEDGEGTAVHVWEGAIWITQERDGHDHHVQAGESFRLDRDGVTLISTTGRNALVSLEAPHADAKAARIVLTGIGSKGPLQLAPTRQPELVARMLAMLGLLRTEAKAA